MVECCARCVWMNVVLSVCVDVIGVCGIEVVLSGGMLCSVFG